MNESKCPICGKTFSGSYHEGSLRLHLIKAHGAKPAKDPRKPAKDPQDPKVKKNQCCKHEWIYLDPKDPRQARVIADGFVEVCRLCGDLR